MVLDSLEFIRRYALHVLPKGFVRIRHYGILSGKNKTEHRIKIREQVTEDNIVINTKQRPPLFNPKKCPCCKQETMKTLICFNRRAPPDDWKELAMQILNINQSSH